MSARAKFQIGERVRVTDMAIRGGIANRWMRTICPTLTGTVTGFALRQELVYVKPDGYKRASSYHMDFWGPIAAHPGGEGGSER